jgi:hypothetical protein
VPYFYHPFEFGVPFDETIAFDNLIYIRDSTCRDSEVGFATTYAHELQHFVQHGYTPDLSQVNSVLYQNLKQFEPDRIASDIPHEREANIVSKRVAEALCGVETVRAYAEEQVLFMEQMGEMEQKARWIFFRDVSPSVTYNLLDETLPFVEKYRHHLNFGVDTERQEWWLNQSRED